MDDKGRRRSYNISPEKTITKNKQWPQWLTVVAASLNYFTAGICFCWSSPSLIKLLDGDPFPIDSDQASWIASLLPIGCAVGSIIGAIIARYLGPKQATLISAFPYLAGFALIIFADGPTWLYISRILSGIAVGFGQTATPIYISELSENHNRGSLMTFYTTSMGLGAIFVSAAAPYLSIGVMAEISSIFPVLFLAILMFTPESPYYLMRLGRDDDSRKALEWFRRQKNEAVILEELKIVKKVANENLSFWECVKKLKSKPNPKAFGIVNITIFAQNFCGAIAVLFYQQEIYEEANVGNLISPATAVLITSIVGNIFGIASILIVDSWGRKPLLLLSGLGCAISTGLTGTYFFLYERGFLNEIPNAYIVTLIALNFLQFFFALGLSPMPGIQTGEMFPTDTKEIMFCTISVIAAVEGFVIIKLYSIFLVSFGLTGVFWSFCIMSIFSLAGMIVFVPETKGKSFLEIQNMLLKVTPSDDIKLVETVVRY